MEQLMRQVRHLRQQHRFQAEHSQMAVLLMAKFQLMEKLQAEHSQMAVSLMAKFQAEHSQMAV